MKKLILLLLFIPLVSFGQDIQIEEYFEDGNKIIEKTWQDGQQVLTLVEIVHSQYSEYRYYINENGVEVGLTSSIIKEYGKYMKIDVSIINASKQRYFEFCSDVFRL